MKTKDRIIQGVSVTSLILWVILSFFNTLKNFDFNLLTASLIIPIMGFGYQQIEKYVEKRRNETPKLKPKKRDCKKCDNKIKFNI